MDPVNCYDFKKYSLQKDNQLCHIDFKEEAGNETKPTIL